MTTPVLSIENITVRAQDDILFNNLSFNINAGEHWAITGESGSGKSALLQVIAGKFNITGGDIRYLFVEDFLKTHAGNNYFNPNQFIALVASRHHFRNLSNTSDFYYQQRYNSADSENALTVEEYLMAIKPAPGRNYYWDLEKVIITMNLQYLRDKQVIKLSNGETKRLMIAAALLKNPVLLLLDNPLTGLDVQTRQQFNALLVTIAQSGITLVVTTSVHEIPAIITHAAVLKAGTIEKVLTKDQFSKKMVETKPDVIDQQNLRALINNDGISSFTWIVKMNRVNISYNQISILKNVDWKIRQGERWALLGANGAGKSTLLSLINGDNPQAYANDITLFDRKRGTGESIWDIKRRIGFVSPELHQYFPVDNSCLQVVESGFYDTLGLFRPSQKSKADLALKWMATLEIDRYARVLLKNIPASAQRLCLLARALIKNPALLIFDEPCQGMDDHQQQHFKNVINAICKISNVTMIYVTHYQHEIPESVSYVLRLDQGEVVEDVAYRHSKEY